MDIPTNTVGMSCFSPYSTVHFADKVLEDFPLKVYLSRDAVLDFPCISSCFVIFPEAAAIFLFFPLC